MKKDEKDLFARCHKLVSERMGKYSKHITYKLQGLGKT